MKENVGLDIREINRSFSVLGPTEVVCAPKGFTGWCTLPYPRHPLGCPNLGKRFDCPPNVPYFLDAYQPSVFVASLDFDYEKYLEIRKEIHPKWSIGNLKNPRHWQNHLRAQLRKNVNLTLKREEYSDYVAIFNPEAMCVNVTRTCENVGIHLEWPQWHHMYRIAILAHVLQNRKIL